MKGTVLSEGSRAAFTAAVGKELELALAACPAPAPSKAFEARMEGLIADEKRPVRRLVNSRAKRVAAALIAAVLLLLMVGFTSERIRSSVAGFFVETFGDHVEYFDPAITKTSIEEEYGLVPVPEGFEESVVSKSDLGIRTCYSTADDDTIWLWQTCNKSGIYSVDNEHGTQMETVIEGKSVMIILSEDHAHAAWIENGYYFTLSYSSPISIDQFKEWIASVDPKQQQEAAPLP